MKVGDLIKLKNETMMQPKSTAIGIIVDVWLINSYNWYQVLWDAGDVGSIAERDIEKL